LLADRDEAAAELVGDGATEDEAARLDADDVVDAGGEEGQDQPVDRSAKPGGARDQRGDVAEQDARLRVIRDGPDQGLQIDADAHAPPPRTRGMRRNP